MLCFGNCCRFLLSLFYELECIMILSFSHLSSPDFILYFISSKTTPAIPTTFNIFCCETIRTCHFVIFKFSYAFSILLLSIDRSNSDGLIQLRVSSISFSADMRFSQYSIHLSIIASINYYIYQYIFIISINYLPM